MKLPKPLRREINSLDHHQSGLQAIILIQIITKDGLYLSISYAELPLLKLLHKLFYQLCKVFFARIGGGFNFFMV